jgi:transposase
MIRAAVLPLIEPQERDMDRPVPLAPIPTELCPVCPFLHSHYAEWQECIRLGGLLEQAALRETELLRCIAELEAKLRLREDQLFGTKADTLPAAPQPSPGGPETTAVPPADSLAPADATTPPSEPKPPRPAPRRRDYSHLPAKEEIIELPPDERLCPCCGQPFADFPGTEDSIVLEIEVKAHRRVIHRKRYRPTCSCEALPGIITAPAPAKLLPKSLLGISLWVSLLLDKFLFYRPTQRCLQDLKTHGLDLSASTINDGLQRLLPLFEPVHEALAEHCQQQDHWHADETRWMVFVIQEGKTGYRWYLWVFHARDVVVFFLASGRSSAVPEDHLGEVERGILNVDRYSAYKAMIAVKEGRITLAFCWAHVRRDFVDLARTRPDERVWAEEWVEEIKTLYRLNRARVEVLEERPAFEYRDQQVRQQIEAMGERLVEELESDRLGSKGRQLLESMGMHWDGLTVFVEHPEVPMDNNQAERDLRGPVVGRKNYYGSMAVWSGQLAAMMFSLFQTLALHNLNPRLWLQAYLEACAQAQGKAPENLDDFLPWKMSAEQKRLFQAVSPPKPANTS